MNERGRGFSIIELIIALVVMVIVTALAVPQALEAVRSYKLHSDVAGVAEQLSVARFRATSQYSPYRLDLFVAGGTFDVERLCGTGTGCTTPTTSCPDQAYMPFTTAVIDGGTQYLSSGDQFTTTNPGGTVYPGTVTGGAASTDFYFNTRGMPVDCTGSPLSNGGAVIYMTSASANLTDAIVITVGGRITAYDWQPSTSKWQAR